MTNQISKPNITVTDCGNSADVKIRLVEEIDHTAVYKITALYPGGAYPEKLSFKFNIPYINIFSVWSPLGSGERTIRPNWEPGRSDSRLAYGAPVRTALSRSGANKITVALSDPKTPASISMGVCEEDVSLDVCIDIFTYPVAKTELYEADLRIDMRDIFFCDAIRDVRRWWDNYGCKNADVPEAAIHPMYSTWYSFHQNLDTDKIVEQCRISKEYGCKAVIIDDGWQTDDCSRGYAFCGDWQPAKKIGNMKSLTDRIHDLDMKVIVWYSVPFVGRNSKAWERFQDCFLDDPTDKDFCVLDPRFPQVREYLANLYIQAARDWGFDGFKLDFIDEFEFTDYSLRKSGDGRDYNSLEDAVEELLRRTMEGLKQINPDICIEFRQRYIGPVMQTYGNMLRVGDCPADVLGNRAGMVDLRLLSGSTAIHSDMLEWNYDDSPENAAMQLINILYSVPQISVLIDKLNSEHKKMLKHYTSFWCKYRDVLLGGTFNAYAPWANYSLVSSEKDGTIIVTAYEDRLVELSGYHDKTILINGTGTTGLMLSTQEKMTGKICKIYDCMGDECDSLVLGEETTVLLPIPASGMGVIQ